MTVAVRREGRALARIGFAALLGFALLGGSVPGQQTIFNVPSPDVLGKGEVYLEWDHYNRPWTTDSGRSANSFLRGVAGAGSDVELGLNFGPYNHLEGSDPFLDATAKWRPILREYGEGSWASSAGIFVGDNAGVGLHDDVSGVLRNLAYAAGFVRLSETGTRLSAGPYYATGDVFDEDHRFGAQ
ncbi:MAG TPA: hypothetical protein VKF62_06405, partial [Planctomycetota bacterium]|nr:hypothetical protein [Planctomycetota bacterium]